MSEYAQDDAPGEVFDRPPGTRHLGRRGGDRAAQASRYYQRHKASRRAYMRSYMRQRRAVEHVEDED